MKLFVRTCHVLFHSKYCILYMKIYVFPTARPSAPVVADPCNPSPCGANAECIEKNSVATCKCRSGYPKGDPFTGCRPECITSADCSQTQACGAQKCIDPCPGLCGSNAQCQTINHQPICRCNSGYSGDPYRVCNKEIRKSYLF